MKKQIIYAWLAFVCVAAVSCKDFLETNSLSTKPNTFETLIDTKLSIYGIYAAIAHQSVYGLHLSVYYPFSTDLEYAFTNAAQEDTRRGIWDYTASSSNSETKSTWTSIYTAINCANECVEGIETGPLLNATSPDTPSEIRHMYGEAKALRALMYLELVRNFGDVPFLTKPTLYNDDFYIEATNRDSILTYLINDLETAEKGMYYAHHVSEGVERFNRAAAKGLIARLALTRGGWSLRPNLSNPSDPGYMHRPEDYRDYYEIARRHCADLYTSAEHNHRLGMDFMEVFTNQANEIVPTNDDMLFEVPFAMGYSGDIGHYIGVSIASNTQSMYGYTNTYIYMTLPYFFSFDRMDKRRDATCSLITWEWNADDNRLEQKITAYNRVGVRKWSKCDMKAPMGVTAQRNTGINYPILRYADVLLMLAESDFELSGANGTYAKEALKTVRKRAFDTAEHTEKVEQYVNDLTDDDFFNAIVNERAWEFGGEGIRKYDLIRWNLLRTKLIEMKETMLAMGVDSRNKSGTYGNLTQYLFYKKLSDGTLDVVVPESNISSLSGYTSANFTRELVTGTPYRLQDAFAYHWRTEVLEQDPMVYIIPINRTVIVDSAGKLQNYYGKQ